MQRKRKQSEMVVGLDIGSTAIRLAIGQVSINDQGLNVIQLIGMVEVPAEGIHRGNITSIEEVVSSLSNALEQAERLIGIPIEAAWVGITGNHILVHESKGVVAVAKSDGEISEEDVGRSVDAARMISPPLNYEILHVMPKSFTVDGQSGIKDPVGMTGVRLEVDTKIVYGLTSHLKHITKAVYRTGIDIHDLVVTIFSTGELVTTSRQREIGVMVVDIGGSTTNIAVYEEGDLLHTSSLPIGGTHVTNDIAIGIKSNVEIAERLKIQYGRCVPSGIPKKEMIDLSIVGAPDSDMIPRQYVAEIIEARVREILEKVDEELIKIDRSGKLAGGVVFVGGGSKIEGIVELAKDQLQLAAALGYPLEMQSITQKVNDLAFVPAVGLVRWGAQMIQGTKKRKHIRFVSASGRIIAKAQDIFKSLIP